MIVEFSDRVGWVLLGMALGYIIRLLQEMKKEVDEVDEILTRREQRELRQQRKRDETGALRLAHGRTIAIAIAILLTLYATFSTGATNNKLEDTVVQLAEQQKEIEASQAEDEQIQLRLARITTCSQEYLTKTIEALNDRTTFTVAQADANVELQRAQTEFLQIILAQPPVTEQQSEAALRLYVGRLQAFTKIASKLRNDVVANPFPKPEQLAACLNTKTVDEKANPDETKK